MKVTTAQRIAFHLFFIINLFHGLTPLHPKTWKFVITGTTASGKDTVINYLSQICNNTRYAFTEEAATAYFSILKCPITPELSARSQEMITKKQFELEAQIPEETVAAFYNRGHPDQIAYSQYHVAHRRLKQVPTAVVAAGDTRRYDLVFLLMPLPETIVSDDYLKLDPTRWENERKEILEMQKKLQCVYSQLNYHIVPVPFDKTRARALYILAVAEAFIKASDKNPRQTLVASILEAVERFIQKQDKNAHQTKAESILEVVGRFIQEQEEKAPQNRSQDCRCVLL